MEKGTSILGSASVTQLSMENLPQVAQLYAEALGISESILRVGGLSRQELSVFYTLLLKMFLPDERTFVYGLHTDGKLVCAATLIDCCWFPKLRVSDVLEWLRFFGVRRIPKLASFGLPFLTHSRVHYVSKKDVRLMLLGCADGFRGKGFGSEMLKFVREEFRRKGCHYIQLEVAEINPAKKLYLRHGYSVIKEFKLKQDSYSIMLLKLT